MIRGCNVSCSVIVYKITVGTMIIRRVMSLQRGFIYFFTYYARRVRIILY